MSLQSMRHLPILQTTSKPQFYQHELIDQKDKALVEGAVKIVYTRIYAALRNNTYHHIDELNKAISEQLELHNNANMKGREILTQDAI